MANRPPESEFAFCHFQNADLSRSIFAETFGGILSVAQSNGKFVAAGDTNGQIHVWQVADGKQLSDL